ncbi:MAG: hypothetical protein JEZ00_15515 [Anaerolineaceae bacterium]|nr:hypothetical protein [Anaerolineaceae bacterium]
MNAILCMSSNLDGRYGMVDEKIIKIFDNVNDLQKFAEAKNGAILALNSAVLLALLSIFIDKYIQLNIVSKIYLSQMFLYLLASVIVSLISLMPRLSFNEKPKKYIKNENFLFFMNLADYKVNRVLFEISGENKRKGFSKFQKNIARQAIINSRITRYKFRMSSVAIICSLSAIFTPLITYPVYFIEKRKHD